jgi:peptidoglycan/LPS O-acetylase OafA/YrhL
MTGGFIGVDVFFVISGYLISQIIIKETKQERFSYLDFYSRRIKRIYPALLLILCFVVYVVPKAYAPEKLIFTFKTLIASTVFGANFQVLVHEKGYFDADIKTNPLLHLWSLGV